MRDIHAQLTAVLGDAKRFLGIDLLAQQAAGIGPGVAGFTRGNGKRRN